MSKKNIFFKDSWVKRPKLDAAPILSATCPPRKKEKCNVFSAVSHFCFPRIVVRKKALSPEPLLSFLQRGMVQVTTTGRQTKKLKIVRIYKESGGGGYLYFQTKVLQPSWRGSLDESFRQLNIFFCIFVLFLFFSTIPWDSVLFL